MKFKTIFQYLIQLNCVVLIICESYYTVIAPGLLKSNRKYLVLITLHSSDSPCTIRIGITGRSYNATDQVQVQPYETKHLEFFPPKLEEGDYKLLAEGFNGCEFRNQSEIFIESTAGPKIYIQTDKSVYKPLDVVQFRVVILDEHTRPVNIREPIRVEIFDNNKNRVKQYKDIKLTKGVFTEKFQLSQQPVMGRWEITVTISGRYSYTRSKQIKIQMYTLPKFSVDVNSHKYLILEDPYLSVEIYGKYTFDKYVEGLLTVELTNAYNDDLIERKRLNIDGLVNVEFNLKDSDKLQSARTINLKAMLQEKDTDIVQDFSYNIQVKNQRYKTSVPLDEIEFRYNKPYRMRVHVEDWNDGPIWDSTTPVIMEHAGREYETYLNEDGVAVFEFEQQPDAGYIFKFKNSTEARPHISVPRESDERQYCKLTLKEKPRLGRPVEVQVRSSFNIPYLVYTVVGHGSIVRMEHIKVPANRKVYNILITPSIEMIPESFLYVHYILNGNLRYEELELKFPEELENQISIIAPKQVKPGQEVTLNVKAQPKSYVSILAVDLSVYLLDNKYDIYKGNIITDLQADRSYIPHAEIRRPGVISGLITLTNAHYPTNYKEYNSVSPGFGGPLIFRKKFPETWIFDNYIINNTDTEIVLNIPETITTWRITAFSNNDITGFGIVDGPTDITTFLPFFVTFNLPFSVKRDEVLAIPVTVFNYLNQSLDTEISMFNDNSKFYFMNDLNIYSDKQQIKRMTIPSDGSKTIKFVIKPTEIGDIEIRVSAQNSLYADGVIKKLKVIPEGITKYLNKAIYLSSIAQESTLNLDIPLDSVRDSEFITLSVGGDFMIPTLENLNDIVKMPTGCGEQNMVNFAPNILILDYLKATGKYAKEVKLIKQAKNFIDIGYQQQLSYRHSDGGYSVFGEQFTNETSTWLTAYVTRFLIKASKYTPIEPRIIDSALEYLANKQWFDGSFPYTGYLFYKALENKYGFTAFVLLTFMEDRKYSRKYQTVIRKGLEYIVTDLYDINDAYVLSLMANALSKAKHPAADKVLEKLQGFRQEDVNGLMWWMANGTDIETTAYTLMALLNKPGNHMPILKWLVEQRNAQGGFKNTHDTVIGLEALVIFAQKYNSGTTWNLKISYSAQDHEGNEAKINEFKVNQDNALTLQQHELPRTVRQVNFDLQGSGYSLVQLSSQYNVKDDNNIKHFVMKINPTLYEGNEMNLEICFTYYALMETISNNTNMVIMEVNLPTGFKTEAEISSDLLDNDFIQRIETKNDETVMLLYFDKLSTDVKHCVNIDGFRTYEVEESKPAAIIMYDYYNTSRSNAEFYTIM